MAEMTTSTMMRKWRRSAGLTQRELARLACIARASISHVENGRYEPSAAFAGRIARALSAHLGQMVRTWDIFPSLFHPLSTSDG